MQKIALTFLLSLFLTNQVNAQATLFKEVSDSLGINYTYPGNDFQMAGGGVMIIDVNNDGWEDFFQSGGVFDSKLWVNQQGKFTDETAQYGLNVLSGYFIQGATAADYNNDGYTDFFISNYGTGMSRGDKKHPVLLQNIKGEKFEMISLSTVLGLGNYTSACWGDINNDGFSDLYITNYVESMGEKTDSTGNEIGYDPICFENKLLLNQKGKGFIECAKSYGVNDIGCGLSASLTDIDRDGDQDLLLLNDFGEWTHLGNKLFRNEFPSATFKDITLSSEFNQFMYGMGIGPGDFDEDGDLDYYVTNIGRNFLFKNTNGTFSDVAKELKIDLTYEKDSILGTSWSGLFFDADFDGDLDLYVSKGNVATLVPKTIIKDANKFFRNDNGNFINQSDISGVNDILSHRGSAISDFDHDGDLDIISSVVKLPWGAFHKKDQKLKIYENELPQGNWIGIKLKGEVPFTTDAFGCRVLFEQENRKMIKEVDGCSGHASQSSPILYYGLGTATRLKKATLLLPNGQTFEFNDLKANTLYEITTSGKIEIKN